MSIIAYADESGMHDPTGMHYGADVATVCGYLSHKESWDDFCKDWQEVLDSRGIKVFHMSEFMNKINASSKPEWPYHNWSNDDCDSFIRALIAVAKRYVILGVGGVLNVRDYEAVIPEWMKADMEHPYAFCSQLFFDCLLPMLEQFDPPLLAEEQVAFFFDQQKQFEDKAGAAFHLIKALRDERGRFGTLAFADKRVQKPLQAADLLAYLMRSAQSRKLKRGNYEIPAGNWEADLIEDKNVKMCYYDAENLPAVAANIQRTKLAILEAVSKQKASG